jgi:hypothetical protein
MVRETSEPLTISHGSSGMKTFPSYTALTATIGYLLSQNNSGYFEYCEGAGKGMGKQFHAPFHVAAFQSEKIGRRGIAD